MKDKYLPYLDTVINAMEMYRDTTRSPVGYQAYPSRFEKVDRYYDDNGLVGKLDFYIDLPWFVTVLFRGYEALYHVDEITSTCLPSKKT